MPARLVCGTCICVHVCVWSEHVRACARACVRACVRARACVCVHACMGAHAYEPGSVMAFTRRSSADSVELRRNASPSALAPASARAYTQVSPLACAHAFSFGVCFVKCGCRGELAIYPPATSLADRSRETRVVLLSSALAMLSASSSARPCELRSRTRAASCRSSRTNSGSSSPAPPS